MEMKNTFPVYVIIIANASRSGKTKWYELQPISSLEFVSSQAVACDPFAVELLKKHTDKSLIFQKFLAILVVKTNSRKWKKLQQSFACLRHYYGQRVG